MRKIVLLMSIICLFIISNVEADIVPPVVTEYAITITNPNGAKCLDGTIKGTTVEYGKTLIVNKNIKSKTVEAFDGNETCTLSINDIAVKDNSFDINNENLTKLNPVKAVILAKGGLNLRRGPATIYEKILTIPQYSIVTIKYRAGTFWFYAEYNGYKGWLNGDNEYFAHNDDSVLYSMNDTIIYDMNNKNKEIGKIPKYTEITDYVVFPTITGPEFLVNYNGTIGYVNYMTKKVRGEIEVLKDSKIFDGKSYIKNIPEGTKLVYTIVLYENEGQDITFYIPNERGMIHFTSENDYKIVSEELIIKKTKGFIGEGLFGEKKVDNLDKNGQSYVEYETISHNSQQDGNELIDEEKEIEEKDTNISKETIIICIMGCIILALVIFILVKFKGDKKDTQKYIVMENKEDIKEGEINDEEN